MISITFTCSATEGCVSHQEVHYFGCVNSFLKNSYVTFYHSCATLLHKQRLAIEALFFYIFWWKQVQKDLFVAYSLKKFAVFPLPIDFPCFAVGMGVNIDGGQAVV